MDEGIFYCKSPLIENVFICWFLIILSVSPWSTTLILSSEIKLSVSLLHERWKDVRCNALWFVRGVEGWGRGGLFSFFFWRFLIWGRFAGWPQSSLLGQWVGVNLDSHRFLLCSAASELLGTRVNAEKKKWFTAPPLYSQPRPRIGFFSLGQWGQIWVPQCQAFAGPCEKNTQVWISSWCNEKFDTFFTTFEWVKDKNSKIKLQVLIYYLLL